MTDEDRARRLALLLATDDDVDWERVEYDEGERWAADVALLKGRLREVEQRAESNSGPSYTRLRNDLRTAREALEYVLEHHAPGHDECLCGAARSVVAAGLSLTAEPEAEQVSQDGQR